MGTYYIHTYVAVALFHRKADMWDHGSADFCQIQKQNLCCIYECYSTPVSITKLVSVILQYSTNFGFSIKSKKQVEAFLNFKLSSAK